MNLRALVSLLVLCLSVGCGGIPKIRLPGLSVQGPKDAGSPAQVAKSDSGVSVALPAGSRLLKTEYAALPATNETPAQPARTVTEILPGGATAYHEMKAEVSASTGTVDTTVRKHQIDVEDRRILLYISGICALVGLAASYILPAWPTARNACFIAAGCAFLAWKFAALPDWLWVAVLVVAGAVMLGYKRAEWDANKDGVPDFLQKKP